MSTDNPNVNSAGYLILKDAHPQPLGVGLDQESRCHVFSIREIHALNAALATRRPLLVRGEPGSGKTQLARAAAAALHRSYVHQTVDARTETRDLLWSFDAVRRLAEAQVLGAGPERSREDIDKALAPRNFVQPGALWWALQPKGAAERVDEEQCTCAVERWADGDLSEGTVVLIDEIDKADPSVPNALLDALGQGGFNVPGLPRVTADPSGPRPLIIITSNDERALPAAFVRRCWVLKLNPPRKEAKLRPWLTTRALSHFGESSKSVVDDAVDMLIKDRVSATELGLPLPGLAELIDLVRAVRELFPGDLGEQQEHMKRLREYSLQKHMPEREEPEPKQEELEPERDR